MRITTDTLLKLANAHVASRVHEERDLLAVYLHGSLLGDEPVLGGAADIDLFFIHLQRMEEWREVVRITDDVHLDISHAGRDDYRQAKNLRVHSWLGPVIYGCKILYDPQHFMDFTQASVRGQFDRPENVLQRARQQAEHARQIWLGYQFEPVDPGPDDLARYLRAVDHAANAIASLSGVPLTERRFLLNFPERANAVGKPGLAPGLLGLIGAPRASDGLLLEWIAEWRKAFMSLPPEQAPVRLHPYRLNYYQRAFEAQIASPQVYQTALWPLLRTWTAAIQAMPENTPARQDWEKVGRHLGLLGEDFAERLDALDAYLDLVEETLETWAGKLGAS
jgi:hypothetical protein